MRRHSNILWLLTAFVAGLAAWCVRVPATNAQAGRPGGQKPQSDGGIGRFAAVEIRKGAGVKSALDFHLDGKGRAVRFYADPAHKDPRTYFNDNGMLYTNGWVVISGVMTGTGEGFNIEHPTKDPSMLAIWSDVLGPAVQARSANAGPESYIFQALDRKANYTFSIEQDGGLRWGVASRSDMDTNLYRGGARTLKTDGSLAVAEKVGIGASGPSSTLHVGGSQSVRRTEVKADYTVTDADYYLGVSDTAARRTVTLPTASGKEGRVYVIKDESGGAGGHPIAVKAQAGEMVDGAKAMDISTNYGVLRVISNGKNWSGM